MKYILDFDRVLFDHDLLKMVIDKKKINHLYARPELWDELNPADFLYTDVVSFLASYPKEDMYILSAYTARIGPSAESYQKRKVFESGIEPLVNKIIIMDGNKAPYVKKICSGSGVFLDDKRECVENVYEACADITCIQLLRPDAQRAKGDISPSTGMSIHVVENLSQVAGIIESL